MGPEEYHTSNQWRNASYSDRHWWSKQTELVRDHQCSAHDSRRLVVKRLLIAWLFPDSSWDQRTEGHVGSLMSLPETVLLPSFFQNDFSHLQPKQSWIIYWSLMKCKMAIDFHIFCHKWPRSFINVNGFSIGFFRFSKWIHEFNLWMMIMLFHNSNIFMCIYT